MSDVKYRKRKKSRVDAQHMAYAIRKRITVELMASFALSQKRIEAYVESATKGIADISEREVTAKLLRELTCVVYHEGKRYRAGFMPGYFEATPHGKYSLSGILFGIYRKETSTG